MDGIIYKAIDYKEKSKLIYLYTPFGLDSFLAQGAKDYKKGILTATEIITYVSYETRGNNLKISTDIEIKDSFKYLKENIKSLIVAQGIMEIVRQTNDSRNERIFNFTLSALKSLDEGIDPYQIFFIYLVKMLKVFGVLDLEFKGLNKTLKEKALSAYKGSLDNFLDINKDDLIAILNYYQSFDFIYLKNIIDQMRFI